MAKYVSHFRSSRFRVKKLEEFAKWLSLWDGGVFYEAWDTVEGLVTIFGENLPSQKAVPDVNAQGLDREDGDFIEELAQHLADGWVAVLMEVGSQEHQSLVGFASAVNADGEGQFISLARIFRMAEELGQHVIRF